MDQHQDSKPAATAETAKDVNNTLHLYETGPDFGLKMRKITKIVDVAFATMTDAARRFDATIRNDNGT